MTLQSVDSSKACQWHNAHTLISRLLMPWGYFIWHLLDCLQPASLIHWGKHLKEIKKLYCLKTLLSHCFRASRLLSSFDLVNRITNHANDFRKCANIGPMEVEQISFIWFNGNYHGREKWAMLSPREWNSCWICLALWIQLEVGEIWRTVFSQFSASHKP